jgi:arylsulfatase A-like enzyme
MRTPWILHWPDGLPGKGRVCQQLVSVIDIAPTLLTLAGADVPDAIQGCVFLPQIIDQDARICDYVFAERNWQVEYCHERVMRHGPWSYYRNGAPELAHFGFVNATHSGYRYPSYVDLWQKFRSEDKLTDTQRSVFLQPRPREQLYYLASDPMEINDLVRSPEHQDVLNQMRATMDRWIENTGDTLPPEDRRTPDRHDRLTGERLYRGMHPGPTVYEGPGQSAGAVQVNNAGPR